MIKEPLPLGTAFSQQAVVCEHPTEPSAAGHKAGEIHTTPARPRTPQAKKQGGVLLRIWGSSGRVGGSFDVIIQAEAARNVNDYPIWKEWFEN